MRKKLILLLTVIILCPFIAEGLLIFQHHLNYKTGFKSPYSLKAHKEFGWYPKKNFTLSYPAKDLNQNEFQVNYSTDDNGFRLYGDVHSQKKKLLFIGDSFTHAREIDSLKTYYGLFKGNYEVFAIGISGTGTWQQYLVLEKYLNTIQPDMVIWQHHINDLFDNHFRLDQKLGYSGFVFDRPYPNTTRLQADPSLSTLIGLSNTRLGWLLTSKYMRSKYASQSDNIFQELKSDKILNQSLENFQSSINIAYGLNPKVKFVHFFVTHDLWFEKKLQEEVKFKFFVNEFSKYIGDSDNIKVDQMGHWNFEGHKRVHKFLAPLIRTQLID